MGCNCGGGRTNYQVKFPGGSVQVYRTLSEAQAAIRKTADPQGSTIKAVPATQTAGAK